MEVVELPLPGCLELRPQIFDDERGRFVKPFQASVFAAAGIPTDYPERYYSESREGVIRGFHFQVPPHEHHKLVYCTAGRVLDVVIDLRVGSPTFGVVASVELDAARWNALFLPAGIAHGFGSLEDGTVMAYAVGTEYAPAADAGIRWDSAGFAWPFPDPVVSERDRALPRLEDFRSPFAFTDG